MKRNRSDSVGEEQRVLALGDIKPPQHLELREAEIPFWLAIVGARARSSWNDLDLCHAVNLSGCLADIESLTAQVQKEEQTVCSSTGVTRINPKHHLIEILTRRSISLCRLLHVHIGATSTARDSRSRSRREKELLNSLPDSDLLAKPVQ